MHFVHICLWLKDPVLQEPLPQLIYCSCRAEEGGRRLGVSIKITTTVIMMMIIFIVVLIIMKEMAMMIAGTV